MKRYKITLTGERDLLLHHDNIDFSERVKKWQKDPANRAKSVAGDDRSPAWSWIGYLYHDKKQLVIPADNLMTVLREGAKRVSTGKRGGTFKSQSQSSILINEESWPLLINGESVDWKEVANFGDDEDFEKHQKIAEVLGFELFVKRAKIGNSKHVRVRPRFQNWSCQGTVTILDDTINKETLEMILSQAGRFAGLGDWRPSSPKSPGPFGTFTATLEEL
jgi:hypothetical protein